MQGSILSPLLYSVFIDDLVLVLSLDRLVTGDFILANNRLRNFLSLLLSSRDVMTKILRVCEAHSLGDRYRFNISICCIVSTRPTFQKLYLSNSEDTRTIPQEDHFTYWHLISI